MFRRSFLQWLSMFSVAGTINKGGQNDPPKSPRPSGDPKGQSGSSQQHNINNLPVVEFDEDDNIANYKKLLKDKNEVLVFVRKEDAFLDLNQMVWNEVLLKCIHYSHNRFANVYFGWTENSKKIKLKKSHIHTKNWKGMSNVS
jgi:hypothetical protein